MGNKKLLARLTRMMLNAVDKRLPKSDGDRETLKRDFLQRCADALNVIIEAESRIGKPTSQSSAALQSLAQIALEIDERRKKGVL